ncbi:hypothetical protein ANANG_G00268810 [Anguilla anguilla]|uniref:Uncharacterized protein n=1 Tax=Anguilla anguilla TaxID=7936 RepID=A0A9D3RLL3_ANGAN|nr:hypothetical protein ANANG_G00268810 [Anguilla anguilla]
METQSGTPGWASQGLCLTCFAVAVTYSQEETMHRADQDHPITTPSLPALQYSHLSTAVTC